MEVGRLTSHERVVALLLAVAAGRTLWNGAQVPPALLLDPCEGPATLLPDLDHDGWLRLAWLPGVGEERAKRIVRLRQFLGVPLTPARLALLPGFGAGIAEEVAAWYARGGQSPPRYKAPVPPRNGSLTDARSQGP